MNAFREEADVCDQFGRPSRRNQYCWLRSSSELETAPLYAAAFNSLGVMALVSVFSLFPYTLYSKKSSSQDASCFCQVKELPAKEYCGELI